MGRIDECGWIDVRLSLFGLVELLGLSLLLVD